MDTIPRPLLPLSILALLLSGCASTYTFKVDAIKDPEAQEALSFVIVSGNPSVSESDLQFQEAANFVRTALSGHGMYDAPNMELAEMLVELDYGIEPPRVVLRTVSEPVYAMVGGQTRTILVPVRDARGNIVYVTQSIVEPPRRELIGFQDRVVPVTVHEKFVRISARENPLRNEEGRSREIWSVIVTNEDSDDDLRKYIPLMVSASLDHLNADSGGKEEKVVLRDNDERVTFVRRGM